MFTQKIYRYVKNVMSQGVKWIVVYKGATEGPGVSNKPLIKWKNREEEYMKVRNVRGRGLKQVSWIREN